LEARKANPHNASRARGYLPNRLLATPVASLKAATGGGLSFQGEVGLFQHVRVVDVVQERSELRLPILTRCLTYPLERTERVTSAVSETRFARAGSLRPVPFPPSPPPPIARLCSETSQVLRDCPTSCGRSSSAYASLDFPTRPTAPSAVGNHRISRFPSKVFPYVHGVSDRAEPGCVSRYRRCRFRLPTSPTASALRSNQLSRLNTRPARTPVNASTTPSRALPHDSGPVWVATPSLRDSFIHNTLPV
jgi:hypothetical protein